jgi:RES domain-containing protein
VTVYRLATRRYPVNDGVGASLYGGRWNHKGTPVIYTAASRALCALEILANAEDLADDYVVVPIEILNDIPITTVSVGMLPPDWDRGEPINYTRDLGTGWAKNLTSAVLSVPSAIIAREQNYLLNPHHPDFLNIRFGAPERFYFDRRLTRKLH